MDEASIDSLSPVRQRTLGDEAAKRLRDAIMSGSLSPGMRLVERELAERLGVSRVPIREAIQQLEDEGLVKKIPHRGTFVYVPSSDELEEIASLRVVLERLVMERVTARWQPDYEARLRQIVVDMQRAGSREDHQRVFEFDTQFHHTLWQMANHSLLFEVVSSLRLRIAHFLYEATVALSSSELEAHAAGHMDLIEVLKGGDVTAAKETITEHILAAKNRILSYCRWPPLGDGIDGPSKIEGDT
jgi:DNA-binding GntR family transcriptional regulator